MKIYNTCKAAFLAVAIHDCCSAEKNYVEVNSINGWNYDSIVATNSYGAAGTALSNYADVISSAGTKILLSADSPLFVTEDGLLFFLDNDKIVIDPENLVKGIGVDVYAVLPGKYFIDFTALNTNEAVIAKITKEKVFPRAAFQPNVNLTNRSLSFALESNDANIDKFIVSVDNPTNRVKKLALGNIKLIEKAVTETNSVTIIEGIPGVLQGNVSGKTFSWYHNGELLNWQTNNFLKINSPLEADGGQYVLRSGPSSVTFNVNFQRNIRIFVNEQEIQGDVAEIPQQSISSNVKLVPFINGLPIRYTLDGTEPTEQSELYTVPFNLSVTTKMSESSRWYLRAKIIIPETDSTSIKRSERAE